MIKFCVKTLALLAVLGLGVAFAASQPGVVQSDVASGTELGSQYLVLPLVETDSAPVVAQAEVLSDWEFTARARPTCRFVR